MIQRNDPCWCHSGKKWKKCHWPHLSPTFKNVAQKYLDSYGILIKTEEQIVSIRRACRVAATILDLLCEKAEAGVTTDGLDQFSMRLHKEAEASGPFGLWDSPLPKKHLHFDQRGHLPRDSRCTPPAGRGYFEYRRDLDRRWILWRLQPHGRHRKDR